MIENISANFGVIIALAAALCAITIQFGKWRGRLRRRTKRLKTANDLLNKHAVALKEFVESPIAPTKMKERLLIFSETVSDHDEFIEVTKQVCSTLDSGRRPDARAYEKEFAAFRSRHPDLARHFETAITSGLAASFLRFSDATDLLEATMARVYADPRTEIDFVAGAVQNHKRGLGIQGPTLAAAPA